MKRKLVTIGFVLTLIWGILIGLPSIASANHLTSDVCASTTVGR